MTWAAILVKTKLVPNPSAKKITFQMALIPGPKSTGVDGKMFYKLASRICLSAVPLPFGLLDRVSCLGPLGLRPGGLGRP